jgi:hypothetical protein
MSGNWPPSGADPGDEEFIEQADQPDAAAAARLAAVSAFLAAAPAPVMPDLVEARIRAALAAESATRADTTPQADATQADPSQAGPTRAAEGPLAGSPFFPEPRHRPKRRASRRRLEGASRRILVTGPAVVLVCLVLVGFGFLLSRSGSSDSSSAGSGGSAQSAPNGLNSAAAGPDTEPGSSRQSSGVSGGPPLFNGTASGTSYSRATLASQVEAELRAPSSSTPPRTLSAALRACALHFTDGSAPALVDRGTYQGTAAYVIASTSRVWVVRLGCTATKQEVIVSVPLAG